MFDSILSLYCFDGNNVCSTSSTIINQGDLVFEYKVERVIGTTRPTSKEKPMSQTTKGKKNGQENICVNVNELRMRVHRNKKSSYFPILRLVGSQFVDDLKELRNCLGKKNNFVSVIECAKKVVKEMNALQIVLKMNIC